jgi:hypothetical protein
MGIECIDRHFLDLAGSEWLASRLGRFTPVIKGPVPIGYEGLVNNTAGLDDLKKREFLTIPGLKLRTLSRPARASRYTD